MKRITVWLQSLEQRERILVCVAVGLLAVVLVYFAALAL